MMVPCVERLSSALRSQCLLCLKWILPELYTWTAAILLALAAPDVDVIGISTVHGNVVSSFPCHSSCMQEKYFSGTDSVGLAALATC